MYIILIEYARVLLCNATLSERRWSPWRRQKMTTISPHKLCQTACEDGSSRFGSHCRTLSWASHMIVVGEHGLERLPLREDHAHLFELIECLAYEMGLHSNCKGKSHFEQHVYHFPFDEDLLRHEVFDFFQNDLDLVFNVLVREILCMVLQQVIIDLGQGRSMFSIFHGVG